jgi:hypothetical protein
MTLCSANNVARFVTVREQHITPEERTLRLPRNAAHYRGVSSGGRGKNVRNRQGHAAGPVSDAAFGNLYELRRDAHTMDHVAAAGEFARVSAGPAAGIEDLSAPAHTNVSP